MKKLQAMFNQALKRCGSDTLLTDGIGRLQEKSVHQMLKYFLCEDEGCHEVEIDSFMADVVIDNHIYEVQSGGFDKLRSKIKHYTPDYQLTIVYPIAYRKHVQWLDEKGRLIKRNKSPKTGSIYDVLRELYKILPFLMNDALTVSLVLMNMEDIRLLDGWDDSKKRGSTKVDLRPTELVWVISLKERTDYLQFIPARLPMPFTSKMFQHYSKTTARQTSIILLILRDLGLITKIGTKNRAYVYDYALNNRL